MTTHAVKPLLTPHRFAVLRTVRHLFDPRIALASMVPLSVGMAIAYAEGHSMEPWIVFAAAATIFAVEVGRSAIDEISIGRTTRVDSLLTDADLAQIAWFCFAFAAVIGTFIANATRPWLLIIGVIGAAMAASYSMPPLKLSSRGLGELALGLVYGPGMVLGSVVMFGGEITPSAVVLSVVVGLLAANVVLVSEVASPDRLIDRRTLSVRIGHVWTVRLCAAIFATAFSLVVIFAFAIPSVALLGLLLGVIPADFAIWELHSDEPNGPARARLSSMIAYVLAATGAVLQLIAIALS